jgi:histidine ammonia-lyase
MLVSAGNFHGQPLAFALDALAMAVSELANISERRVERLVNPNLSDGLPAFLTTDGGLNSGFMIPQYVAASLVSENKSLCHPASVDSIPTSAGQEDHVSMGNASGLKAWQVVANRERALAIELLAAAQGALGLVRAQRLARAADCACALSLEALQGSRNSFLPQVHALRPLRGQAASARNVVRLLDGSAIIESHRWCDKVQDAYSLRCAPQVHGASRDLLDYVEYTVTTELNAATDNPLVLVEDGMLVSAGNFHGQPLAFALDALAMAVSELANISERRVERLVNPNLSDGLPAFLTTDGGLNSGFMIPQYVAASLVSENKSLCHPASVDSIPTSAGQEDHVSMGNASGLKASQVVANSERALAIELLAAAQAIEFLAPLEPGRGARAAHDLVRSLSPRLRDDRPLGPDIEAVADAIRDGSLVAAVDSAVGELE